MSSSVTATCPRCKKPFRQAFDFDQLADSIIERLRVEADCPNRECEARVVIWVQAGGTCTTELQFGIPIPDDDPPPPKPQPKSVRKPKPQTREWERVVVTPTDELPQAHLLPDDPPPDDPPEPAGKGWLVLVVVLLLVGAGVLAAVYFTTR